MSHNGFENTTLVENAVSNGLKYLIKNQRWDEEYYTATGFPGYGVGSRPEFGKNVDREKLQQGTELSRGFMLSFNMYRHYFPLIALARALGKYWSLSKT